MTREDMWGLIPSFMHWDELRSVREQFNERYIGGWRPFKGFKLDPSTMTLTYPGDPPYRPIDMIAFRDERLYLYPYSWVLVMQHDGSWEVCRMD